MFLIFILFLPRHLLKAMFGAGGVFTNIALLTVGIQIYFLI